MASENVYGGENMFELRIHGRDGQGMATVAEWLSIAALKYESHT